MAIRDAAPPRGTDTPPQPSATQRSGIPWDIFSAFAGVGSLVGDAYGDIPKFLEKPFAAFIATCFVGAIVFTARSHAKGTRRIIAIAMTVLFAALLAIAVGVVVSRHSSGKQEKQETPGAEAPKSSGPGQTHSPSKAPSTSVAPQAPGQPSQTKPTATLTKVPSGGNETKASAPQDTTPPRLEEALKTDPAGTDSVSATRDGVSCDPSAPAKFFLNAVILDDTGISSATLSYVVDGVLTTKDMNSAKNADPNKSVRSSWRGTVGPIPLSATSPRTDSQMKVRVSASDPSGNTLSGKDTYRELTVTLQRC